MLKSHELHARREVADLSAAVVLRTNKIPKKD